MKTLILIVTLFLAGCYSCQEPKDTAVKINNYRISQAEFEQEFQDSVFARDDTPQSRREFLDNLIDRTLILQDAQGKGLDKDPKFLKAVEKFWAQSLLKSALEKKSREIAGASSVSDKEIEEAYKKMFESGRTSAPYDEMYQELKWELTRRKESAMMNDWLVALRKQADIRLKDDLIPKDK